VIAFPIVLATQNPDKAREITEIFVDAIDAPLVAHSIDGIAFLLDTIEHIGEAVASLPSRTEPPDVEETGATLEENARIKASALVDAFGWMAIADDTGLDVDALGGAPGVHAARFAGAGATYSENVAKLLRDLAATPEAARSARFVTVAMARGADGREVSVRGVVEGVITETPRGSGGFGYDPVFEPAEGNGRTFAEMAPSEKHAISHRGRAFRALVARIIDEE
jgi:XTP/dITP diphosphohydrolase